MADMARGGKKYADVGTDHGYIAVSLALRGEAEEITATDIRPGPLAAAEASAAEYGVSDKIRFVLCDGLDYDGAETADTVVIAGMGGETICGILSRAPWTKNGARIVMQPQTKPDETCLWLQENGYALTGAAIARDAGRLYAVIEARGGVGSGAVYLEDVLLEKRDPLLRLWLDNRLRVLRTAIDGAETSAHPEKASDSKAAALRLSKVLEEIQK